MRQIAIAFAALAFLALPLAATKCEDVGTCVGKRKNIDAPKPRGSSERALQAAPTVAPGLTREVGNHGPGSRDAAGASSDYRPQALRGRLRYHGDR